LEIIREKSSRIINFSRLIKKKKNYLKTTDDTALSVLALSCRIFDSWRPIILQRRGRGFAESDMDAEKLSKRDTLKRKEKERERGRDAACMHACIHARTRAHERRERRNKGGRGRYIRSGERQRERRKDEVREKGEGKESLV